MLQSCHGARFATDKITPWHPWISLDDLTVDRVSLESMEMLESLMLNIPEFVDQPT